MALELRVLGTAAGGGFPQWNCACHNCARARLGEFAPRLQDSLSVSADAERFFLLNASPDVARQIEATPALWPRARRASPIQGVVLTNGDLDHALGLLLLRENQPLSVYATARVRSGLEQNAALRTLTRFEGQLVWRELVIDRETELLTAAGGASGIALRAFAAPGKPPLHLPSSPSREDNVGLELYAGGGRRAVYVSATARIEPIAGVLEGADSVLLDGTFWSETELIDSGLGAATASEMAHLPVGGSGGSLARCRGLGLGRRLLTHVNNTNPLLDPASAERELIRREGWELAEDGLVLRL